MIDREFEQAARKAAVQGGEVLKKYWGKVKSIQSKGFFWDLVTEADINAEKVILSYLHQRFPEHQTLSEEAGAQGNENSDYLWVIDPLDGTTNYTHQYPFISVSIGLVYRGKPIVGAVYNPIFDELFLGSVGGTATLNGHPIHVSSIKELNKSLLATGFAYDRRETSDNNYAEFCHMTHISQGVRRLGSAALDLAYVAAGRLEGFWERGLKTWDMAAGVAIVTAAGGTITNYEGDELDLSSGRILATNGFIHPLLIEELRKTKG